MGSLYVNDMSNVEVRYKFFTQTDIEDKVILDRKVGSLQNTILNVKQGQNPLFVGLEQGSGRNRERVYLLMIPRF